MVTARYSLPGVFAIIDAGDLGRIWFSAPSRSLKPVLKIYQSEASGPKDPEEAKRFICRGIRSPRRKKNFVRTVIMWGDANCLGDEYGLICDNRGWYAKLPMIGRELDEIWFHPPERELKTVGGLVIPAGGKVK